MKYSDKMYLKYMYFKYYLKYKIQKYNGLVFIARFFQIQTDNVTHIIVKLKLKTLLFNDE
jgi:hypothetical protein